MSGGPIYLERFNLLTTGKTPKNLYTLLRQVFGPKSSPVAPLLSKDKSTLIKDPDKIMDR